MKKKIYEMIAPDSQICQYHFRRHQSLPPLQSCLPWNCARRADFAEVYTSRYTDFMKTIFFPLRPFRRYCRFDAEKATKQWMKDKERPDVRRSRWTLDWSGSSFFLSFSVASVAQPMLSHSVVNVPLVCRLRYPRTVPLVEFHCIRSRRHNLCTRTYTLCLSSIVPDHSRAKKIQNMKWHFGKSDYRTLPTNAGFSSSRNAKGWTSSAHHWPMTHTMDLAHCSTSTKIKYFPFIFISLCLRRCT